MSDENCLTIEDFFPKRELKSNAQLPKHGDFTKVIMDALETQHLHSGTSHAAFQKLSSEQKQSSNKIIFS